MPLKFDNFSVEIPLVSYEPQRRKAKGSCEFVWEKKSNAMPKQNNRGSNHGFCTFANNVAHLGVCSPNSHKLNLKPSGNIEKNLYVCKI